MRQLLSVSLLSVFCCLGPAGCAADMFQSFDVVLAVQSDCSQTGSNDIQCADEELVSVQSTTGRWVLEDRGGANAINPVGDFLLTTEVGVPVSGLYFSVQPVADGEEDPYPPICSGNIGQRCYLAFLDSTIVDVEVGCQDTLQTIYAFRIDDEGIMRGEMTEQQLTAEGCGASFVSQRITSVVGTLAESDVLAREENGQ